MRKLLSVLSLICMFGLSAEMAFADGTSHEYVDLGLPSGTLWATMNMGATAPEALGDKYCWGSTVIGGDAYTGTASVLPLENDAARQNWGGDWRMPTQEEVQELIAECVVEETETVNGVLCYKVSRNSQVIYFPYSTETSFKGYWTSTRYSESAAYYIKLASGSFGAYSSRGITNALYVRPVKTKSYQITAAANDVSYGKVTGGGKYFINDTTMLTATPYAGYVFANWTDGAGNVVGYTASIEVVATADATYTANFVKPEYVDMGLGVCWSKYNLGAANESELGGQYAWGATEIDGAKYTGIESTLPADKDAAHVTWGGDWRMPTLDEANALRDAENFTWEIVTENGVQCYKVTSKITGYTDNYIYLPFGATEASYWLSTADATDNSRAKRLNLTADGSTTGNKSRGTDMLIRPVQTTKCNITAGIQGDGNVTGGGVYFYNTAVTLKATPKAGYVFANWTDDAGNVVGYNTSLKVVVTADVTYTANFIEPEYVDLGVSTILWSKYNLGAANESELGGQYAWGATEIDGERYMGNEPVLPLAYDAARANWAGDWRMPTSDEFQELLEICVWTLTTLNDEPCYKVEHPNDASKFIYMPYMGETGYYWTSSLYSGNTENANYVKLTETQKTYYNVRRSKICYVRPVQTKSYQINAVVKDAGYGEVTGGGKYFINETTTLTVTPNTASDYMFANWTDGEGNVVGYTASIEVVATADATYTANFVKPEYVDMGLGVCWSKYNLGAAKESEIGGQYAWGATEIDGATYTGTESTLPAENDAAHVTWGGDWRMPTLDEANALRNAENCSWEIVTENGVQCYKVTSKVAGYEGNYIYLPFGADAFYWLSTPDAANENYAKSLHLTTDAFTTGNKSRGTDMSIRPVQTKSFEIEVVANNPACGEVTGGGKYFINEEFVITATANEGCVFVGWSDGVTDAERTLVATADATYEAIFEPTAFIFRGANGSSWSDETNWSGGEVPTANDIVTITAPCVVNASKCVAKSITLDKERGATLTIAQKGSLTVVESIYAWHGVLTEGDIIVKHDGDGQGQLLLPGYTIGEIPATVDLYAPFESTSAAMWNAVGMPFESVYGTDYFVGSYLCALNDATKEYYFLKREDPKAFAGYLLTQKDAGRVYPLKGNLVHSTTREIPLVYSESAAQDNGWNFIANSWLAPILLKNLQPEDFGEGNDQTVYLIRNGSYKTWPSNFSGGLGGGLGGGVGDGALAVNPLEAFFVIANTAGTTFKLDYARVMDSQSIVSYSAPAATRETVKFMALYLTAENGKQDELKLLESARYTSGFDNGGDGRKIMNTNGYPNLSIATVDGEMAAVATNDWDKTCINFRKGDAEQYTFSFEYAGNDLRLYDMFTNQTVDIETGNTYTFMATENDLARFMIQRKPDQGNVATAVQNVWVADGVLHLSNPTGELTDVAIYTTDGRLLESFSTREATLELTMPMHGMYIIELTTLTGTQTIKQIF